MVRKPPAEQGDVEVDVAEPLEPPRRRRTWPQRILLSVGVVVSVAAIATAAAVGWAAWRLQRIDRTDVALDQVVDGGPRNYLIVGSDTRSGGDPNDPGAADDHEPLADTIMVLRIDPDADGAAVLSLPRDLWVTQAGSGEEGRINAAYATGGPQRLVDTLKAELDIPINHYLEVDFAGFQRLVTAVDGVPMWFDRAMRDRNSGLDVLHPGCTTLDGYGALAFARARHLEYFEDGGFTYDGTGDLGRISRQQLFLRRVIDRTKAKGISNPLTLKRLVEVGTDSVTIDDDLPISELLDLGRQYSSFDSDSLATYTLPTSPRTTSGGAAVEDLDQAAARPILDRFRTVAGAAGPTTTTGAGAATADGPTVSPAAIDLSVLNSSGRQGLAVEVADALVAEGYDVEHWGNGAELGHGSEEHTVVRYGDGAEAEAALVAGAVAGGADVEEDPSLDDGAVALFLGTDFTAVDPADAVADTATTTTATEAPTAPTAPEVIGMVPGDPPPGRSCG